MKVFVGMESSGVVRRAFARRGHDVYSCDYLESEDWSPNHLLGEVFQTLEELKERGWWPDLAIFHPDCTYHTLAAAWAFADPDYERYPSVGYHQRVKGDTLVGAARRDARVAAESDVERIAALPIAMKAMENPRGTIPTRTSLRAPTQVIQPYEFGHDASKATCLWLWGLKPLTIDPRARFYGRKVIYNGKTVERWSNQTDSGQNRLSPSEDRWNDRSRTYLNIGEAMARDWGKLSPLQSPLELSKVRHRETDIWELT